MSSYYSQNDCSCPGFCPVARDHGAPGNKIFKQHELMLIFSFLVTFSLLSEKINIKEAVTSAGCCDPGRGCFADCDLRGQK